jgi:hypothetical protein
MRMTSRPEPRAEWAHYSEVFDWEAARENERKMVERGERMRLEQIKRSNERLKQDSPEDYEMVQAILAKRNAKKQHDKT